MPVEQITSINDTSIKTVDDVERALAGGGEVKVSVKRMLEGRTVKFRLEAAKTEPKEEPK